MKVLIALLVSFLLSSCAHQPEPPIDQASVVSKNASLRLKNSSTSRTIRVFDIGDKVEVLERQGNWYRVRYGPDVEGWMEESTVLTSENKNRIQQAVAAARSLETQNTAVLKQDANLRFEPGRSTSILRKLDNGTKVEVLDRVTKPRPGSDTAHDMWLRVRPAPTEVGWVLSSAIDFDIPTGIADYSEEYIYSAVKILSHVEDPIAGKINWYVVGERKPGSDPDFDFDGIRVFTWNMKKHRYETAFRTKGMRGVYPLSVGVEGGNPTIRVHELSEDGVTKIPKDFVMYGVIVRQAGLNTKTPKRKDTKKEKSRSDR
jgi:hypothetical protein